MLLRRSKSGALPRVRAFRCDKLNGLPLSQGRGLARVLAEMTEFRDNEERYCPICERTMYETLCPLHQVKTIPQAALKATNADIPPGTLIGERYRVDFVLGGGAMGTVYAATQTSMERRVALKIMVGELMQNRVELKRFYREAKNASRIKHPNVVQVYDFGVDEHTQLPFLAMELAEGRTLAELLAQEAPLDVYRAAGLLEQVSRALVAAHDLGIIHRDLKPENMMVGRLAGGDEHLTVLDFGIAKAVHGPGDSQDSLTAQGVVVGTPRYMSPEQVTGQVVDQRSDLYSLGCIMHEMLTGRPPFTANELVELMLKHINSVRPPPPQVASAPELQAAVAKLHRALLHRDPDQRPVNAARVAAVLRRIARRQPLDGIENRLHDHEEPLEQRSIAELSTVHPPNDGGDLTDTHVKARPLVKQPVDSQAFADIDLQQPSSVSVPASPPPKRSLNRVLTLLPLIAIGLGTWAAVSQKTTDAPVAEEPQRPGSGDFTRKLPSTNEGDSGQSPPAIELPKQVPPPRSAPHPKMIAIRFSGTPRNASVYSADRRKVCRRLPCTVKARESTEQLRYSVEARNHYKQSFVVKPDRNRRVTVKLLPLLAEPTY